MRAPHRRCSTSSSSRPPISRTRSMRARRFRPATMPCACIPARPCSCAARARPAVRSRWNRRSTRPPMPAAWTRWRFGWRTMPSRSRFPANRSPRNVSTTAMRRPPSDSAGRSACSPRVPCATRTACASAGAWARPPSRWSCSRPRRGRSFAPTAPAWSKPAPRTWARAHGPRSPRSRPTASRWNWTARYSTRVRPICPTPVWPAAPGIRQRWATPSTPPGATPLRGSSTWPSTMPIRRFTACPPIRWLPAGAGCRRATTRRAAKAMRMCCGVPAWPKSKATGAAERMRTWPNAMPCMPTAPCSPRSRSTPIWARSGSRVWWVHSRPGG